MSTSETRAWRIGDEPAVPKIRGGIRGEIVVRVKDPESGAVVRELTRTVFLPIDGNEISIRHEGSSVRDIGVSGRAVVGFPVRMSLFGQTVNGTFECQATGVRIADRSPDELLRSMEASDKHPRLVFDATLTPTHFAELEEIVDGEPIKMRKASYAVPETLTVTVFDRDGLRVGKDGTRYRARDAMPSEE